ncbi:MAG: B12-binding domain-containing radical SAM protein [Flavobacteriales bacterium]|nr:B12-binding domain-containing radical SAM protein [Flavobacteriales bacterium]
MRPYPTLGLLYISAFLNEQGIDHDVFDTTFSTTQKFKEHLLKTKPNVVAFYTNLMTKVKVISLIQFIRNEPDLKDMKVVLGGPDLTYNIENYLKAGADYLVIGEGEQTFFELVEAIKIKGELNQIEGLAYLENGQVVKTKPRTKIKELDELPIPNRGAFPIKKYLETWKTAHGESALNVSTQRGCPYTCKWCSTAVYGQSYRRRSPANVVAELAILKEQYQPDTFWFVDDVFTVSHKWLKEFHAEILRTGLKVNFECITRAERMNTEVIQWLKEAGCIRVWIGAESGSQRIIDAMDRRVDVNQVRDLLIQTREAGIQTGTFIMVGYPGETIEDIRTTAKYLEDALPDYFTITKSYPIKGTRLFEEIEANITEQPDWFTSTDREIDFKRKYSDSFYNWAIRYVNNRLEVARKKAKGTNSLKPMIKAKLSEMMMLWKARF